ncbi:MAG: hypothetical protein Q9187_008118 [Circinaria calcarea]
MTSGYATPTRLDKSISNFEDVKGLTRDRPWLLSTNRKLRHLQGISLRNLCLSKPSSLPRGKTIDDGSLPTTLKSPAKILAQRENRKLEHSRSSSDLAFSPQQNSKGKEQDIAGANGSATSRPIGTALRRRSTLNWASTNPMTRQKRLEDATGGRMADTWFSIHCSGMQEPVYISEIMAKAMNPSFQFFDLNTYGSFVTRQDQMTIKFWARTEGSQEFSLLIELQVHLGSLQFVGKSLESFYHPLPENCIVFHLSDGIYTSFTDLPLDDTVPLSAKLPSKAPTTSVQPTSSLDALMRLSNLDDCIQDALATREQITTQIEALLSESKKTREVVSSVSTSQGFLASTQRAVSATRRALQATQKRKSDLQASITARRAAIQSGRLSQKALESHLSSAESTLASSKALLGSTLLALNGQIRRICEDLSSIYPIEPIEGKPLSFTIRDLYLPNANFFSTTNTASEATTAAALGMVAHILHLLSHYLSAPLPYPITPHGSTSSVHDPITVSLSSSPSSTSAATKSPTSAARTFPLFQTGSVQYRFEYGVFLLNTDLEVLMWKRGLRMVDQRQTLANLKYLLVVCGSGKGEVPRRKKGVVGALVGDGDVESRAEHEGRDGQESEEVEEGNGRGENVKGMGKGEKKAENGALIGGELHIR